MRALHLIISGDVQGVGFRQYIRYRTGKLNVKGWIRNLSDGRVEAEFFGDEENLKKMHEISRRGPYLAGVKHVESFWKDSTSSPENFQILK